MAISKDVGRQYPLVARVPFTYADFGASGVAEQAVDTPAGAKVIGGELVITTAFNSATSDAIDVGDGVTPGRYLSAQDVKTAAGRFALVPTNYSYAEKDTIDIEWTGVGTAPTQGAGYLLLQYILEDRANENV